MRTPAVPPDDPRLPLLELLERHARGAFFAPDEEESRRRLVAFVASTPDCFLRSNAAGHVTGSAWIVDAANERVVLLHHRKLGRWLQPGGHADGDADVARVALREAEEETGITGLTLEQPEPFDLDVHAIPARRGESAHFHYDVRFLFRAPPGAALAVSDESHAVRWVAAAEVPRYTRETSILRMLGKGWPSGPRT